MKEVYLDNAATTAIRDEVIDLMRENKKHEAATITKNKGAVHVENLNTQVVKLVKYAQNKAKFFNNNAIYDMF